MRRLFVFLCFLSLSGCRQDAENQHYLSSDGKPKPVVAILPIMDISAHSLSWDVSEELSCSIKNHLLQKESFFLDSLSRNKKRNYPTLDSDLSWIKSAFPQKDFIVFIKLIEHQEVPLLSEEKTTPENSPAELRIRLELRIVDVRNSEPKILLEEQIEDTQYLPKQFTSFHFLQVPWGKESYSITPVGIAHAKLAKEISSKIEKQLQQN